MRKNLLFCLLICFVFFNTAASAQSWLWGRSSGSAQGSGALAGPDETIVDMTIDPNGNIYTIGKVYELDLQVDGQPVNTYGVSGENTLLSSFACDGTYRWSKFIGGNYSSQPISVKADAAGGVYILCGLFNYYGTHIGDSAVPGTGTIKQIALIKYDTAGNLKWYHQPEPDTMTQGPDRVNVAYDIDVDANGNVSMLCALENGAYAAGSYIVSSPNVTSMHILKYNSAGDLVSGLPLDVKITGQEPYPLYVKIDHGNGRIYITGSPEDIANAGTMMFGTDSVTRAMFIGCFNADGSSKWYRQNTSIYSGAFARADIDAQHNIYLAGNSESFNNNDTFNNYVLFDPSHPYGVYPMMVKLDTNGNNVWITNGYTVDNTPLTGITLNGDEVVAVGSCPGPLNWVGSADSLNDYYYDIFIARFNATTGALLGFDTVARYPGYLSFGMSIVANKFGSVYVGGNFDGESYVNTDTLINSGGFSDLCVAKFGYDNCNCTTTPVAGYSYNVNSSNVNFTYTGTTTSLDSVVWNFGDGTQATGNTTTHIFPVGLYDVCATAYTGCGSNTYCDTVIIAEGVPGITAPDVYVYPNPATNELVIAHATTGTDIKLFSIVGRQAYSGTITSGQQVINTQNLAAGSYILQLTDKDGNRSEMKIVKE